MAEATSTTDTINGIEALLEEARTALRNAEQVAATVPRLRREIKFLEKAYGSLTTDPTPRRTTGPTIKDSIYEALEASGGRIEFKPGQMLSTVHALTGGKRNSVQVEIHRLRNTGRLVVERNSDNKPIAISIARQPLTAVPTVADRERLEG